MARLMTSSLAEPPCIEEVQGKNRYYQLRLTQKHWWKIAFTIKAMAEEVLKRLDSSEMTDEQFRNNCTKDQTAVVVCSSRIEELWGEAHQVQDGIF